ncbi:hypothetical protein FACS189491_03490 [Spirochaetia bacterium]|nr:hypothetical protein FACS189491_03490 [Spirochaetia bacterium]
MKDTKIGWSKMLLWGMFGVVLTFGLVLAGCGGGGNSKALAKQSYDLAGEEWRRDFSQENAAELDKKAADIDAKLMKLSEKDREKYDAELARLMDEARKKIDDFFTSYEAFITKVENAQKDDYSSLLAEGITFSMTKANEVAKTPVWTGADIQKLSSLTLKATNALTSLEK